MSEAQREKDLSPPGSAAEGQGASGMERPYLLPVRGCQPGRGSGWGVPPTVLLAEGHRCLLGRLLPQRWREAFSVSLASEREQSAVRVPCSVWPLGELIRNWSRWHLAAGSG